MIAKLFKIFILLVVFVWLCGYTLFIISVANEHPINPTQKTDAIIVLTGGNYRIQTGLNLLSNELSDILYITGVHQSVSDQDIKNMWKENTALPDCCIELGRSATTTLENAIETKEWAKDKNIKSIRLVTSAYHMRRALIEFANKMDGVKIIAHPVEEYDYGLKDLKFWILTFDEYNKILFRLIVLKLAKQG